MIERLNHVAIVVPDLKAASALYRDCLGANVSEIVELVDHGVSMAFVQLENSTIELLHPLDERSPVANFLKANHTGGLHHICYEVSDIIFARDVLRKKGMKVLGNGEPKNGAHGNPVLFLHPRDFCGTLIELEQIKMD